MPGMRALPMLLVLAAALPTQDDLRDRVTRTDGKVVHGRVVDPFGDGDELLVLQGGKRVRVPRADVADLDLVADRVREFCERRRAFRSSPKGQAFLIDRAAGDELPGLARAQAIWLALAHDHEAAHEFLGHERSERGWLWSHDGRKVAAGDLDAALAKAPLTLIGERFTLRCDRDLAGAVAALLDLEQLGVAFRERFGAELRLHEVLRPIAVVVHADQDAFPKWGFRPVPFYEPPPHADVAHTFWPVPGARRPDRLFFVGTQGLLYRTLIGEASRQSDRDRICAWLEVGFGMVMEQTMQGDPGFAAPATPRRQDLRARTALFRDYRLTHLLRLPMYGAFYLLDDTATAVNWSAATMFTTWLLQPDNDPPTRERFCAFVRAALAERRDGSSLFDDVMGTRVEDLDAPWRRWLADLARQ